MADDRDKIWKPLDLVKVSAEYLAGRGVPGARLDAELLLCHAMGMARRVDLYAGFETEVPTKKLAAYRELIRRRAAREPVSRILGRREFMSLAFKVTPDVLSPRPETELLVEAVIEAVRPKPNFADPVAEVESESESEKREAAPPSPENEVGMSAELERLLDSYAEDLDDPDAVDDESPAAPPPVRRPSPAAAPHPRPRPQAAPKRAAAASPERPIRILDLGTGSGCIAVSLAFLLPQAMVVGIDASPKALLVARDNGAEAGVGGRLELRRGDWFASCRDGEKFDVIVSNPPYLVEGDPEIWPEASQYDPPGALYAGRDGLDAYRRIVPDAPDWLVPGGRIFFEVGAGQGPRVAELLERRGFTDVTIRKDYAGHDRVVTGATAVS